MLKYYCLISLGIFSIIAFPSPALGKSNKECLLKGVCLGQEIKQLTNVGLSECSLACSEYFGTDQECWGTTYFRDSKTCSVYSDCPEIDDGVNEAVTNRNTCFMYSDCKYLLNHFWFQMQTFHFEQSPSEAQALPERGSSAARVHPECTLSTA